MKISVVTIVYNDVKHIQKTIESVLSQTALSDMEYVVVDGKSTDGTSDIIKSYQSNIDNYICETDSGIYNAMNKGLKCVTGDYVIFMNSGDAFSSSSVVADVLGAARALPELPAMIYGDYRECSGTSYSDNIPSRHYSKIWYGAVASHQSTFYNVAFLRRNNLVYDESYKIAADYKLSMEVITLAKGDVLQLSGLCVCDFDITGVSCCNQNRGLEEANRARREVLHYSQIRIAGISLLQLSARYLKRFAKPLYKLMRH